MRVFILRYDLWEFYDNNSMSVTARVVSRPAINGDKAS